ncbi:contractile injection system protein, VgrG/Pvc8 family [Anaeromicropila populeti]|uniref:Phage late control gene D protein (GPD) n=1 Tax=Anaeromicropila populeti TaxID=37658 RepID=A0A1I6IAV5_9FIRM|nr:contractile injection system protein, VgrG/Pvc8 family [Anaeromicropila populeti]SFR63877.1 Phage late control gene D protein (GPD) [Anaeromicropila populeti]
MREVKVVISGFEQLDVKECKIHKGINEHGYAVVQFTIDEDAVDSYISSIHDITWGAIKILDENNTEKTIFSGIITEFKVENRSGDVVLTITYSGGSCLLDYDKKIRTFQKSDTKVEKIIERVLRDNKKVYAGQKFKINESDTSKGKEDKGELIVQYLETDYQFIKRIASHFNEPLITIIDQQVTDGVLIQIGLPAINESLKQETQEFARIKSMNKFMFSKKCGLEKAKEDDYVEFSYRGRDCFEIGSKVKVNGENLYVYQVDTSYNSEEFINTYVLASKNRFKVPKEYNYGMIGASLDGVIEESVKDKVKISCVADDKDKPKDFKEFPYATVYSSPDGTGWYCMPEKDDLVRLYFPTEQEKDSYVINAVHLKTGSKDRSDVNSKSLMNKHLKQVEFHEKYIRITNNKGMFVSLDDDKGITIVSDKDINIESCKEVKLVGKKALEVSSPKEVLIKQGGASVELKGKINIKGANVNME